MGVTDAIARWAARRAHVLVAEVPGHWRTRFAVERAVLKRGWSLATSPADADLLAVCGTPGPRLRESIDLVWEHLPGPRVRIDLEDSRHVEMALDEAHAKLLDTGHQRYDAHGRPAAADLLASDEGMDHGSMDHGAGNHEGHEDMDMDMAPGGIALAQGGEDRDGLEMDVLTLRLGPVLPHWPAGLVLRCALQGDVVTQAGAEFLGDGDQRRDGDAGAAAARTLDNIVSLLALAGWDAAADEARRVRDAMLAGDDLAAATRQLDRLRSKVTRSRSLRWSLRGVGTIDGDDIERHGLPGHLAGDTHARLLGMLDRAAHDLPAVGGAVPLDRLGPLMTDLDLAALRLVVASLDLHDLQPELVHGETSER